MTTNSSGETMPKLIHDYREDHLRRQEKFFQSVFLTSSTLLGILISLQPDIPTSLCNHILRLCALFLLCISCLLDAILLYGIANHSLTVAHHLEKLLNNPDLWQKNWEIRFRTDPKVDFKFSIHRFIRVPAIFDSSCIVLCF